MKQLIEKITNIFKIPELRKRILYTLGLLAVYRLGTFIILPGIDSAILEKSFAAGQGSGILGLLNTFVGGAFSRGSIFALGIMPYISASIIVQLMGAVVPTIQKWQKEGESGQKRVNQLTRYLTVLITFGQGAAYMVNLKQQYAGAIVYQGFFFWLLTAFLLTAGTMFLVWLGERITDNGIGNGVSLIIMIGIVATMPGAMLQEFSAKPLMLFFVELILMGVVTMGVVALTQATRKIPINYARRMMGNRMAGGMTNNARQYIPLKVNSAGVMPIIFAQAIMFLPASIPQLTQRASSPFWFKFAQLFSPTAWLYSVIFAVLIIVFTYFYTAIIINPNDIADQLKRTGGFIPGVKPGKKTAEFIDTILSRVTLPGSVCLAIVAIFPWFSW